MERCMEEDRNYYRFIAGVILAYLVMMFVTLCIFAYDVFAQSTEDLIPDTSVTEADAVQGMDLPMHEVGSIFSGSLLTIPIMDIEVNKNNLPMAYPGNFTLEQLKTLREAQVKQMIKLGWLPDNVELRSLTRSRFRSVESEVEIYRTTIKMHDRAIKEGLDYNWYVNLVNSGSPRSAEFIKDAVFCGDGFLLYPNSNICSHHGTLLESERHYNASLDTIEYLNNHYKASVDTINQLKAENAYLKTKKKGRK